MASTLKKSCRIQENSFGEDSLNINAESGMMKDSLYNLSRIHSQKMKASKIKTENIETRAQIFLVQDSRNHIYDSISSVNVLASLSDVPCLSKFYPGLKPSSASGIPEMTRV